MNEEKSEIINNNEKNEIINNNEKAGLKLISGFTEIL